MSIDEARAQLAPNGVLRAGINLGNFLLVTGKAANGDPEGVSPDMAQEIANRLGVKLEYKPMASPGEIADTVGTEWDIGNIGAEPERAKTIDFTAAYCEIEANYLVHADSPIKSIADVDKPGVKIAVSARSAYGLWLEDNIKHAELVQVPGVNESFDAFVEQNLDVYAGLRPKIVEQVEVVPGGGRILDGKFTAVQQAIGCKKGYKAAHAFLSEVVEECKASGMVGKLIEKHGVKGKLSVAPPTK